MLRFQSSTDVGRFKAEESRWQASWQLQNVQDYKMTKIYLSKLYFLN